MKNIFLILLISYGSCVGPGQQTEEIRLALLGQSVIEHDPREYLENPLPEISKLLSECEVVFTNLASYKKTANST